MSVYSDVFFWITCPVSNYIHIFALFSGVDRLAFSVMWELNEEGEVLSQWTGRTVIRSCVKLAYFHAQRMVDGVFDKSSEELPKLELPHTWDEVILCSLITVWKN